MNDLKIGQVVQSRAGRDKGQFMVVIGIIDGNHVSLSNGRLRKVENPKKKKNKHLLKTNHINMECQNQILNQKNSVDEKIREILKSYEKPDDLGEKKREEV